MEDTSECREGSEQGNWILEEERGGVGARTPTGRFASHGDWASLPLPLHGEKIPLIETDRLLRGE